MNRTLARMLSLVLLAGWGTAAWAQLAVEPETVAVSVAQGETAMRTLMLTNTGSAALVFCLSFERPLQRTGSTARLSADALGGACGSYGEVLALVDTSAIEAPSWNPYGLTMTPEGRLFTAEVVGFPRETYELTPSLEVVRAFEHPVVEEVDGAATGGVTYDAATGTLWWLNVEGGGFTVERALLVEGDLDGMPTGRRIEIPVAETAPPPAETGAPGGLSYDPVQQHFFFIDSANETIWVVGTLGSAVEGYPVLMEAYPGVSLGRGLNALPTSEPEGLRIELTISPPGPPPPRLVVVGRYGEDTAPGAEPLETPLLDPLTGTNDGDIGGEAVRSVLDPNGVLYYPWSEFQNAGIVAVRPHPLPPSWLVVETWDGTLAPGESTEIALTFRPAGRSVGEYTAVLQAFEAESGAAVEVPLSMTVTQGTDAEDAPAAPEVSSLTVHPNPTGGSMNVALTLDAASHVRIVVYDMLGRTVAALHEGRLAAGEHELTFDGLSLPAGVYIVRATGDGFAATQRMTVLR